MTPLITLHAVTHALDELGLLDDDERALAIDRAEILIRRETGALSRIWAAEPLPEAVLVFLQDAAAALDQAQPRSGWFEWIVTTDGAVFEHPGVLLSAIAGTGMRVDLYVPSPGVPFFARAVAAILRCEQDDSLGEMLDVVGAFFATDVEGPVPVPEPRQVFRQFDFARGGPVRDLIAPMSARDTPGQPLLVPGLEAGEIRPVSLPPRAPVEIPVLPVINAPEMEA